MSPLIMKTCEGFARFGFDVELWIPRRVHAVLKDDPFAYHAIERIFSIRKIPVLDLMGILPGKLAFPLLVGSFAVALFFTALFRMRKEAILYFHDIRDTIPFFLSRNQKFLEVHDFYASGIGWINRAGFRRIMGFVVTNRFKMNELAERYGISARRMLHQPNAVDILMFDIRESQEKARQILNLPLERKIILYTGHLFGWKGVDALFDAHQFLNKDEVIYFVGGTDEDIKKFKNKTEKLNVRNIVIAGRRPHAEIPLWLRAADIVVLPNTARDHASKFETSPVKLFEYMASSRPIVASDLPSIRNVVNDDTVWFAEPDDPRAIAEAIRRIFADAQGAARRVKTARREVLKYSWENRTRAIVHFIQGVSSET
ncbi:MAG: glycosyltransferase family 4 protein [Patescibacteria group bacterium]